MKQLAFFASYLRLWLRPRRRRLALALAAGLAALVLSAAPMWWGVAFSPLAQPLTAVTEAAEGGFQLTLWGQTFRFKTLDVLMALFS